MFKRKDIVNFISFLSLFLILIIIIFIDITSINNNKNQNNNNQNNNQNNNNENKFTLKNQNILIVIPGGGLLKNGSLPLHSISRMNKAINIFNELKDNNNNNVFIVTLSAGTPHKPPPLDQLSYPIYESSVGIKYLLSHNIPFDILLEEKLSLDTIGNAYFLRAIHTEFSGFRKLIVITNDWHMKRTRLIFETVFQLPLNKFSIMNQKYELEFIEVPAYLPKNILLERQERENQSYNTFLTKTKDLFHTFEELHQWIFTKHSSYSAERFVNKQIDPTINENILKSY